ncbi:HK97 family phage prohead protease [Paludisphaera mucosa]|uniref:HK97 family phage prohead protease n=1 Tax=Paludisphaera mucosa TaxID=3030827 RepID=A0ABT6F6U0_9BACT|nr:HK97 family phage prohead protease [Paludisphaera mucosa]MDG3003239.1 HK97 family phage prohead protease [Paludisphaera mucosa]
MATPTKAATPDALLHKSFDVDLAGKGLGFDEDGSGGFTLYAAIFGNVDRVGDVIEPGSFLNLDEFSADGVGLYEHDLSAVPIAYVVSAVQDSKGLRIEGRFHSTPEAQKVRTVVKERTAAGKSVKCSLGYKVARAAKVQVGGREVQSIRALRVYEFSFVNLPANPLAGVVDVKSATRQEEPMEHDDDRPGMLDSVKQWLGFATKSGRAMSKANHAALRSYADQLDEHGDKGLMHAKSLRAAAKGLEEHGNGTKALAAAMHKHLETFDPNAKPDPDDGGDEPDGDDAPPAKKAFDDAGHRARVLKLRRFVDGLADDEDAAAA